MIGVFIRTNKTISCICGNHARLIFGYITSDRLTRKRELKYNRHVVRDINVADFSVIESQATRHYKIQEMKKIDAT